MVIDCETCAMRETSACAECVVTFVIGDEPAGPLVVDESEFRALRLLGQAGLVPRLRHRATMTS
jgi:hypothetical protein